MCEEENLKLFLQVIIELFIGKKCRLSHTFWADLCPPNFLLLLNRKSVKLHIRCVVKLCPNKNSSTSGGKVGWKASPFYSVSAMLYSLYCPHTAGQKTRPHADPPSSPPAGWPQTKGVLFNNINLEELCKWSAQCKQHFLYTSISFMWY